MTKPLRIQFIVADSAHARWVKRAGDANDFVTVHELKAHASKAHAHGAGGHDNAHIDQEHAAFARQVADSINEEARAAHDDHFALVAPARTLAAITEHLSTGARGRVVRTLAKDLAKTPDHALGDWLRPLELG